MGSLADALGRVSAFNVSATRTVFAKHVETPCQALGDATRTRTAGGDPSLVPHAAAHRQNTVKGALRQKHRLFEQPRRTRTSSKRPVLSLEADLHRWSSHTNRPRVKIAALRAPSQPVTPVWKYLPLHGLRRRQDLPSRPALDRARSFQRALLEKNPACCPARQGRCFPPVLRRDRS